MSYHPPARLSIFSWALMGPAIAGAFRKLDPRQLIRNPVMFTTAVVALLLTVMIIARLWQASLAFTNASQYT